MKIKQLVQNLKDYFSKNKILNAYGKTCLKLYYGDFKDRDEYRVIGSEVDNLISEAKKFNNETGINPIDVGMMEKGLIDVQQKAENELYRRDSFTLSRQS